MNVEKPIRNPDRVIRAIKAATSKYPNMRVAQLITNAYAKHGPRSATESADIFYLEDNMLAECLEKYIR